VNHRILFTACAVILLTAVCNVDAYSQEEATEPDKADVSPAAQPGTPAHPPIPPAAAPLEMPAGTMHLPLGSGATMTSVEPGSVPVAEGGLTIEDLFAKKAEISGQAVKVRGKVVKATRGVMGTNWYHIQDGTGAAGSNDLAVTSDAVAKVGDLVVVAGTATTDKDIGVGYKYSIIVEHASLKTE